MNFFEQLALGGLCTTRALREAWRPVAWLPWLLPFTLQLLVLAALVNAAHPLLSPLLAHSLRAVGGDEMLRYPQLFHRLGELAARAAVPIAALVAPIAAGAAARIWASLYSGLRPDPAAALREALRRAPALVVAALPTTLVLLCVQWGIAQAAHVRLSGLARLALPQAGAFLVTLAQAACFYSAPLVMLGGRGPWRALTGLPMTWRTGFVPAAIALVLLAIPMLPVMWLEPLAAAGRWRALPEMALVAALLRAGVQAFAGVLASGAATLAWLSAVARREDA